MTLRASFSALLLCIGCGAPPDPEFAQWRMVLEEKKLADQAAAETRTRARQKYIDTLREFCGRFPTHQRAREVYLAAELEFARELFDRGEYEQARPFFESVLRDDPENAEVREQLEAALRRRFLTRSQLEPLRKGMRPEEVAAHIGRPLPGWSRSLRKTGDTITGWYYARPDGGVGGVYFKNGRLFAAEYDKTISLR